jgi:large subunit ribosomal protein LX
MDMTEYTVTGTWLEREGWQDFETAVTAPNADVAEERAYATIGSRHGHKRSEIEIEEVEA